MLVKEDLINKIKDYFDLNVYETKVWLALLSKGTASAGEVAGVSGVPRSRTYDVLESLEKKGFAIIKLGKPVKYLGVKPKMILDKLKNNIKRDAEEKISNLSNIKETDEFLQLEKLYNVGVDPIKREDISAALKGRSNISSYLREIIQNAKKEVIICTSASEILSRTKIFQQTFETLKKSNIKIKLALFGDEKLIKQAEKSFGMKVLHTRIEVKFFIVDKDQILFYLSKESNREEMAIWLNSDFFTKAFASLFEIAMGKK